MKVKVAFTLAVILAICLLPGCQVAEESYPTSSHEPTHNMTLTELETNFVYHNIGLDDGLLLQTVESINQSFNENHPYIPGETDCNNMAVDIWNMLAAKGITSVIACGNLSLTNETFEKCNHAWLVIFDNQGASYAVACTIGEVYHRDDVQDYPELAQYWEGFFYTKPSDLRADLKERWRRIVFGLLVLWAIDNNLQRSRIKVPTYEIS